MSSWAVGIQLGPYTLISPVGAGGMGEVWKARDNRLNRAVAVKRLKGQHSARFEQEARAIAALNHPNICQIYDIGSDYLVLEYIEGKPLAGPLPPEEAVRLAIQIVTALDTAHRHGVVHRDLKPANIMVTPARSVKLLDFGLAKQVSDSEETRTIEGTVMGTAAYMAPEQAQGKPLDARSDVFSFGAVLYELLSGRRAFSGENSISTMAAILHKEPAPLDASPALQQIVKRCLAKQPAQRFQTMAELKGALEVAPVSGPSAEEQPSIAVLPFANMSADKDNEYFSDGLAEEIINALAQVPGLKVTARTSAFAFRGKEEDIQKIAEALHVKTVLEGSVRRAGNRIRVMAQLINAADGYHLWSQRYDREMADVFAIQDEISQAIAAALQVKLAPAVSPHHHYQPNLPAYEAYLKAQHFRYTGGTPESFARSRQYYEQAIELDPKFAIAHSELGFYLLVLAVVGILPAREAYPLMRIHAQRALEIDPSLPEAHAALGVVAAGYDYDWKGAEQHFRRAMACERVPPIVRFNYGTYLFLLGRPLDAAEEIERCLKEDPLFLVGRLILGQCLQAAGRNEDAVKEFRKIVEFDESFAAVHASLSMDHLAKGMLPEALSEAEKCVSLSPWVPQAIGTLAGVLARTGNTSRAKAVLQKLGDGTAYGAPIGFVAFHSICGEVDEAIDWLEKVIEQRQPGFMYFLRSAEARVFQTNPRWPDLMRMMNLPDVG